MSLSIFGEEEKELAARSIFFFPQYGGGERQEVELLLDERDRRNTLPLAVISRVEEGRDFVAQTPTRAPSDSYIGYYVVKALLYCGLDCYHYFVFAGSWHFHGFPVVPEVTNNFVVPSFMLERAK